MFIVRGQSREPELTHLTGETSRGGYIGLTFLDGKLQDFRAYPSGLCTPERIWRSFLWSRSAGMVDVERDESRFRIRERSNRSADGRPLEWVAVMRGELDDDDAAARSTLRTRWTWDEGSCEGRLRFSLRKRP